MVYIYYEVDYGFLEQQWNCKVGYQQGLEGLFSCLCGLGQVGDLDDSDGGYQYVILYEFGVVGWYLFF